MIAKNILLSIPGLLLAASYLYSYFGGDIYYLFFRQEGTDLVGIIFLYPWFILIILHVVFFVLAWLSFQTQKHQPQTSILKAYWILLTVAVFYPFISRFTREIWVVIVGGGVIVFLFWLLVSGKITKTRHSK